MIDSDGDTSRRWSFWNSPQEPGKKAVRSGDQKNNRNHTVHSNVKTNQNTLKKNSRNYEKICCHSNFSENQSVGKKKKEKK